MHRNRAPLSLSLLALLTLSGCATVKSHWPFGAAAKAPPAAVHELDVLVPAGAVMPVVLQYWERNTLVIDLQGASTEGAAVLQRVQDHRWPARIAFRMAPRRFEKLEVRGNQRMVWPVSAVDVTPVTVVLAPSAYDEKTPQLTVRWGADSAF